ncbi:MAG: hypothetical protein ACE5EV_03050 [Gaiellales bacterium]
MGLTADLRETQERYRLLRPLDRELRELCDHPTESMSATEGEP